VWHAARCVPPLSGRVTRAATHTATARTAAAYGSMPGMACDGRARRPAPARHTPCAGARRVGGAAYITHTHCTGPRRTAGCSGARATACAPVHDISAQAAAPRAARKCVAHRASVGVTGACCGYCWVHGTPSVRCSLAVGGRDNDCTPDPVDPALRRGRPLSRADATAGLAGAAQPQ
jgi:hypothetical protein